MLEGKVALITGSTRNIGYGIAKVMHGLGAAVYVNGRSDEAVQAAIESLADEGNAPLYPAAADMSKEEEVRAIFAEIERRGTGLDILVSNACHLGLGHSFLDTPMEFLDAVLGANVRGHFLCGQLAGRMMKERGGGAIINVGSVTAYRAIKNRSAYITSKGALESMTRAMAVELGAYGIRVNCAAPGYTYTERWDELTEDHLKRRRSRIPLGQEATPLGIGEAVAFLASDGARHITGATLPLCAGTDVAGSLDEED